MNNLTFVLWMILWPLSNTIEKNLLSKRMLREGKEPPTALVYWLTALVEIAIWIYVGRLLYRP